MDARTLCHPFGVLGRDEFQRDAVHAVAEPGGRRAVVEHVAEMAAAAAAMDLITHHTESVVGIGQHRALDGLVEAWPAGAAVELGLRIEQLQAASGAREGAGAVLIVERAGEGALGVLLAQHRVLLWREQLSPFLWRVGDFEGAGHCRVAPADQAKANCRRADRGDGNGTKTDLAPCERHQMFPFSGAVARALALAQTRSTTQQGNSTCAHGTSHALDPSGQAPYPREATCASGITMTQRTPFGGKESLTSPSSAFPTTLSIMARPKPERSGVLTGGPPCSSQVSFSLAASQNCQWMRTRPRPLDSAPYFCALVASSCSARPRFCTASGFSITSSPSMTICPPMLSAACTLNCCSTKVRSDAPCQLSATSRSCEQPMATRRAPKRSRKSSMVLVRAAVCLAIAWITAKRFFERWVSSRSNRRSWFSASFRSVISTATDVVPMASPLSSCRASVSR